ncbi:MAG: alpha/beta hydrolase family protein [Candidatus Geothermincolia bacterium]
MTNTDFTDVEIQSGGETLRGDMLSPGDNAPLVVLCHGIPLSRPDPSDPGYAGVARQLGENGLAALFVNFRGCGTSTGNFHLGGWYEDLCSVMKYARGELNPSSLFMAGFSAGGALAVKYAAEHGNVDGVATFATPSRLSRIFVREQSMQLLEAARDIGIIKDLDFPPSPDWFIEDAEANEAIDYVAGVSPVPLLIVHGDDDELVPLSQGRELFEAAGEPKSFVCLPGGEHRLRHDPRSIEVLLEWLPNK